MRSSIEPIIAQIEEVLFTGIEPLPSYDAFMSVIMKRRHRRHRLVEPAKLWPGADVGPLNCMLMDVSHGGAHLRVPMDFRETGDVLVSSQAIGHRKAARIVWRDTTSIGIAFRVAS